MIDCSVIVALYNSSKKEIELTLGSVLKQIGISFEIVLADDASENDSLNNAIDYLESEGFHNYKVCRHSKNVGTVKNINDALEMAEGKYAKPLGVGDTLFDENVLCHVCNHMSKSSAALCFGKLKGFITEEKGLEFFDVYLPYDIDSFIRNKKNRIKNNIIINHGWIVGASMFYEKERIQPLISELVGKVKYCEDLVQTLVILNNYEISFYDDAVVYYEMSGGISTSSSVNSRNRMKNDLLSIDSLLVSKYRDDIAVVKGTGLFKLQLESHLLLRKVKIILHYPGYVMMVLRTKIQRRYYRVEKKGFLEKLSVSGEID